jgi:hypothetical protein
MRVFKSDILCWGLFVLVEWTMGLSLGLVHLICLLAV